MAKQFSSFFTSLYFAVVAAVTLFTLMFGTIDFVNIGLKTYVFPMADRPSWGISDCNSMNALQEFKYRAPEQEELTEDELKQKCELQNEQRELEYRSQKAQDSVRNLALIIVSLPLFLLHFRFVLRELKIKEEKSKK